MFDGDDVVLGKRDAAQGFRQIEFHAGLQSGFVGHCGDDVLAALAGLGHDADVQAQQGGAQTQGFGQALVDLLAG